MFVCSEHYTYQQLEFTDHQRTVFCVFSGEKVNLLRKHLNDASEHYGEDGTMFDDRGEIDENDAAVATLMNATGINDDDDEMDEVDGVGSQDGEAEG